MLKVTKPLTEKLTLGCRKTKLRAQEHEAFPVVLNYSGPR